MDKKLKPGTEGNFSKFDLLESARLFVTILGFTEVERGPPGALGKQVRALAPEYQRAAIARAIVFGEADPEVERDLRAR